ncbi:unnamed protein product [Urochloa humidicola]
MASTAARLATTRVCIYTHGSLRAAAAPAGGNRCGLGTARQRPFAQRRDSRVSRIGELLWSLLPAKASDPSDKPRRN